MTADFPDDDVDDYMEMAGPTLIGDRRNIRVQIFDGAGAFLDQWTHLGPPSSI